MAAYYGKSRVFDPRFLARKAKLDSINSISQNPHGWTSILAKLSVDPCFPLSLQETPVLVPYLEYVGTGTNVETEYDVEWTKLTQKQEE